MEGHPSPRAPRRGHARPRYQPATHGPTVQSVRCTWSPLARRVSHSPFDRLPRLEAQVVKLLATCRADLDALPKPLVSTKGSIAEVFDRIVAFCADLRDIVYGRALDKSLVHRSRHVFLRLKQDLRCTAPDFRPFERPQDFQRPPDPEYLKAEDEISARFDSWFVIPGEDGSFPGRDGPSPIHSASVSFSELASEDISTASSVPVKVYNAIGLYDVRKIIKE